MPDPTTLRSVFARITVQPGDCWLWTGGRQCRTCQAAAMRAFEQRKSANA